MSNERLLSIVLGPPLSHLNPISVEQLRSLAVRRSDVDVQLGQTGTRTSRDMVVFDPTGVVSGTLYLIEGRLQTKNPDDKTIEWMVDLAREMNGRVVDSSGRTYRSASERYIHPEDVESRKVLARKVRIARNKRIPFTHTVVKWAVIGIFAALAGIGAAMFGR